jgi:hypothetical protein
MQFAEEDRRKEERKEGNQVEDKCPMTPSPLSRSNSCP